MGALTMEIEKLNNTFISEKHQKQQERKDKEAIKERLFNYFYNTFKKSPHGYEEKFKQLQYINEREKILNKLSQSDSLTFQYLNSVYTKTLKEVYNIFKNNYTYISEKEQEEENDFIEEENEILQKEQKKQELKNVLFFLFQYFSIPALILYFIIALAIEIYTKCY